MNWIDILTIPSCPACEGDLDKDAFGSLPPTWVSDSKNEGWITCGHCGDFQGESLEALWSGEIVEI